MRSSTMGGEVEHVITTPTPPDASLEDQILANETAARSLQLGGMTEASRQWFSNGCMYLDHNAHPELCSRECRNGREVAQTLRQLEAELVERALRLLDPGAYLYKANAMTNGTTCGAHESHEVPAIMMTSSGATFPRLIPLLAFMASRIIILGNGHVVPADNRRGYAYRLSQRADFITAEFGGQHHR